MDRLTHEYGKGYVSGFNEAKSDRWTAAQVAAYVASYPARNEWERGYEAGLLAAVSA